MTIVGCFTANANGPDQIKMKTSDQKVRIKSPKS